MLKTLSKYAHVALALSLILPLDSMPADAKPSGSSSFKGGFSSQRSSSSSSSKSSFSSSRAKSSSGSFGSFSRRPSENASTESRSSASAMSRKLDRERSEANALRTLDERRAAQAARERNDAPRPAPGGSYADDRRAPPQGSGYGYGPAPAQPPVIINNNGGSGLGNVVAGAILARSMTNAHANNNANNNASNGGYYPAPSGSAGDLANQAGAGSVGDGTAAASTPAAPGQAKSVGKARAASVLGAIFWLCVLALIGCGIWFLLKRRKSRREANKPNYSFERN